jgi:pSer/pThr/pTyr-binding forkhead associated (FHA) protein
MFTGLLDTVVLYWHYLGFPVVGFVISTLLAVIVYGRSGIGTGGLLIRGMVSLAALATLPMAIDQIGLSIVMSDRQTFTLFSVVGSVIALLVGVPYVFIPARANAVAVRVGNSISSIGKSSGYGGSHKKVDNNPVTGGGVEVDDAVHPNSATVVVTQGKSNGSSYRVIPDKGQLTIGRSIDNTVVVDDHKVSRHHASIVADRGRFHVEDNGSSNGTFVNGSRISSPQELQSGATVRFGDAELVFKPDASNQEKSFGENTYPAQQSQKSAERDQTPQRTQVKKSEPGNVAWLAVVDGQDKGKRIDIGNSPVAIGRSSENDLVLGDTSVSRHHASLLTKDDKFVLYDAGSGLGTKVNGELLTSRTIGAGDTLTVGDTDLMLVSFENEGDMNVDLNTHGNTLYPAGPNQGVVLVAQTGSSSGKSFPLKEGLNLMGRDPGSCNILLDDQTVGREHCTLRIKEGAVTVHDLGSSNGTFVNGNKLNGKILNSQDTLTIGSTKIAFIAAA